MAKYNELNDDEIRVIGSGEAPAGTEGADKSSANPPAQPRKRWWLAALLLLAAVALCFMLLPRSEQPAPEPEEPIAVNRVMVDTLRSVDPQNSYTEVSDTVINRIPLQIFKPVEAVPELVMGNISPNDTTIVLAAMAADYGYEGKNIEVVGAFVYRGEILSKSKSKQGYCALLNGNMFIGKALTTPYFEQCVTENGDFFRQFALVEDGQIVAPDRKQRSVHRGLCLIDGHYYVIDSQTAITNEQFAEVLVALHVETAISLMGSAHAVRWACDKTGRRYETGDIDAKHPDVASYLVWRRK
ncbi:MAG: hypothetical protein IJ553_02045 [Alloprevotella sp.]|nr:hypothetical protein [Alloprevotella sp.]